MRQKKTRRDAPPECFEITTSCVATPSQGAHEVYEHHHDHALKAKRMLHVYTEAPPKYDGNNSKHTASRVRINSCLSTCIVNCSAFSSTALTSFDLEEPLGLAILIRVASLMMREKSKILYQKKNMPMRREARPCQKKNKRWASRGGSVDFLSTTSLTTNQTSIKSLFALGPCLLLLNPALHS